jgi:hypothetical protein
MARSIPGFKKPQGVVYVREVNKLFVASGNDGMLKVTRLCPLQRIPSSEPFNRQSLSPAGHVPFYARCALRPDGEQ